MRRWILGLLCGLVAALAGSACAQPQTAPDPFAHWAAVIVAGDWRAAGGVPTEGFDNARRDLAKAFVAAGFSPDNVAQLSTHPDRYPAETLHLSELPSFRAELDRVAAKATDGCLVYLTSHGTPYGVPLGIDMLTPARAAQVVGEACGQRPTVVISACFSGMFVPDLKAPNRMVLTAARPDRTSFGCGQNDRYPYFDDCILKSLPNAHDFEALAKAAQTCVARREKAERLSPPSEPQLWIGAQAKALLPSLAFAGRDGKRSLTKVK